MTIQPLFLLSLPRTGSTLVQRVLASHESIRTVAENGLLLHLLAPLRDPPPSGGEGWDTRVALWYRPLVFEQVCAQLPEGRADVVAELRALVLRLFTKLAGRDSGYFLDKTGDYIYVARELVELFPDGKFIFLWRHPLAVTASQMDTYAGGAFEASRIPYLFEGPERLVATWLANRARSIAVRYEDLVSGEVAPWRRITDYLELEFDPDMLRNFSRTRLAGGDPEARGSVELTNSSLDKWKSVLANPVRKAWCRRYLRWLGGERLATMGYDLNEVLAELDAVPTTMDGVLDDLWRTGRSVAWDIVRPRVMSRPGRSTWPLILGHPQRR